MKKLTTSNCMATKKLFLSVIYIINPSDSVSGVPFVVVYFDK